MGRPARSSQWPLVGRDSELEAFERAWAGQGCQGMVICGPAGVGKSRLAEECLARAVRAGFSGGRATATAAAAKVPLGAIAHLFPNEVNFSSPARSFAAVARALAGPNGQRRWALLVDDLHLLDATSAMLLQQLLHTGTVRLIGTVRADNPSSDAVDLLSRGDALHRVNLETFDQDRVRQLLRAVLRGRVGWHTVLTLHEASGGNLLYLHELVHGALAAGTLASDGEIWELTHDRPVGTPRLAELIGARLAAAGPARPVLELLALCEPVPLTDAENVAPLQTLAELENAELIHVLRDGRRTTVALAHPLYGEVLRANLSALRRRVLLLAQAQRVQEYGARRRDDLLHIASWHLTATGTADSNLLSQAAKLACRAHDYPEAIRLLAALPSRSLATDLMLGGALRDLGKHEEAEEVLKLAAQAAITESDKLKITLARTANFHLNARFGDALTINDTARTKVSSPAGQHCLLINEGAILALSGDPKNGLALLESLEADVSRAPEIETWVYGASRKIAALALAGRTSEALALGDHAYATHQKLAEQVLLPSPNVQLTPKILALSEAGLLEEARTVGRQTCFGMKAVLILRAWVAFYVGRAELLAGHPASARHWFAEAIAMARRRHHVLILRLALTGLATSMALLGDSSAAELYLAEADTFPYTGYLAGEERLGEAWILAARGEQVRARSVLIEAAATAHETGHVTSEGLLLMDVARLGGANDVSDRLAELARQSDGNLAPARAHLAAALAADAPDQLLAAAEELEAIGADLLATEATTTAAAAWRRAGQARQATAATQQAQARAARCQGARTPLLAPPEATSVLTARELEVALCAAAGTASKDIAAALHLSVRTVYNHLQHAYAKLGVTNRRELADTLGTRITRVPSREPALGHWSGDEG
ncbi:LuxR C-terminal-related transcriptional regulator [Streptomyces sp. NPDC006283]|uniref:helix-turn-helix transcriptional regulator n=1 Tax=Streptomyces sp. NPDC006283 TaxID=3156741 RepID=UPI0033B1EB59